MIESKTENPHKDFFLDKDFFLMPGVPGPKRRGRLRWLIAAVYVALLVISHLVRAANHTAHTAPFGSPTVREGFRAIMARAVDGEQILDERVRVSYREYNPGGNRDAPVVVLLHGSPGSSNDFNGFAPSLSKNYRLIIPDLPGFGNSSRNVPDYSIRAHAHYVIQLLDELNVRRAHFVGFSMGGGVALQIADLAPDRVTSITLLSSIGVQEMELLGDYHLNHALHGLQLAGLWFLSEGVPHMGWLDDAMLSVEYARNFFDTDQRPLRHILSRLNVPVLILHGREDVLVPVEAAIEHHRLTPQSELVLNDENHFTVFTNAEILAGPLERFLDRVESGQALTRANADPARVASAALPFDPASVPKADGITAVVLLGLIAAATLVSEDLTSIGVGVMVAQGRVSYLFGAFACFLGIFVGDVLLFLAGRYLGRPALKRAPLKWFIREKDVERSSAWFTRRGIPVIAASRFVPGMRLPTYFAAGLLNTSLFWFSIYFLIAGVVWTPLLVGLSAALGGEVIRSTLFAGQNALIKILVAGVVVYIAARLLISLASYRGRRLLVSSWRRKRRWEFWPPWIFYPPVLFYVFFLALKHRGLSVFTAANPGIAAGGGFIGESKAAILEGLSQGNDECGMRNAEHRTPVNHIIIHRSSFLTNGYIAKASLLLASLEADERTRRAEAFMSEHNLSFPVVLKPDAGQRGSGVAVVRSKDELEDYLRRAGEDAIIQEHVPGFEFGVFYYRYPGEERGRIFSITEKLFPVVVGDGESTLERLILKDERAVCMARFYFNKQADRLWEVPSEGERVQLVEIGTHCRGAIFLDGSRIKTDALEEAIDRISHRIEGFHFGRFDIRTPSVEEFEQGKNFKIIELNGVTSEATHIYDPQIKLFDAYKILFEQWRIAFEIGAENLARGARPTSIKQLARMLISYRQQQGSRPD